MKKSGKRVKKSLKVDRISGLPDEVLCHILSFLPTVESVATCILSSRWKYLWRNTSCLSFSDEFPPFNCIDNDELLVSRRLKFANFVSSTLELHSHSNLERFHLRCIESFRPYNVSRWISRAIMRGIQSLDIIVKMGKDVVLPSSLFTCDALEVLQLEGAILINLPSLVCLPKLIAMALVGVHFQDDQSPCKLVSSCTSLESLIVGSAHACDSVPMFSISSSSLRDIRFNTTYSLPLSDDDIICNPEIVCPALQTLHLFVRVHQNILLPSNLFNCNTIEELEVIGSFLISAAHIFYLPNLRKLKLHVEFENDDTLSKLISSCMSLESLDIERSSSDVIESNISSLALRDLRIQLSSFPSGPLHKLLIDAPVLRFLHLHLSGCVVDCHIENLSSLEEAEIHFHFYWGIPLSWYKISNIFQGIWNVKILTIRLYSSEKFVPLDVPVFHRLTKLDVAIDRGGWGMLQELIQKSTSLENLKFFKSSVQDSHKLEDHDACWRNPSTIPACLLSSLRSTAIIVSDEDVLAMAKYILENAKLMRKTIIRFGYSLDNKIKRKWRKNLSQTCRGSEECELLVIG